MIVCTYNKCDLMKIRTREINDIECFNELIEQKKMIKFVRADLHSGIFRFMLESL